MIRVYLRIPRNISRYSDPCSSYDIAFLHVIASAHMQDDGRINRSVSNRVKYGSLLLYIRGVLTARADRGQDAFVTCHVRPELEHGPCIEVEAERTVETYKWARRHRKTGGMSCTRHTSSRESFWRTFWGV